MSARTRFSAVAPPLGNLDMDMDMDVKMNLNSDVDVSDLEPDDSFERMMFQQERDERRLKKALGDPVQAFRKAQARPHAGLTVDNLARNSNTHAHGTAHVQRPSPPSSNGSTRSDPAIHAPASWGRKGRTSRSWMRSAIYDDHQPQHQHQHQQHRQPDSPLSHKGDTTHNADDSAEIDLTFDLNEASILASTPYIPRNPALDDIRAREDESLRSPSMRPRPRSNHSWQSPPINVLHKSVETVGPVERPAVATAVATAVPATGRVAHRRKDSQELLRRLARASNTPSPRAATTTTTAITTTTTTVGPPPVSEEPTQPAPPSPSPGPPLPSLTSPPSLPPPSILPPIPSLPPPSSLPPPPPAEDETEIEPDNVDATPLPVERPALPPKTPVVMGAWVDTPGPRTAPRPSETSQALHRARSPEKSILRPSRFNRKSAASTQATADDPDTTEAEPIEAEPPITRLPPPQLPSSALHALVQEAKAHGHDYGNDTINSLEGLLTPPPENPDAEIEEDTLQGLDAPTAPPRNQAERERQQETMHIRRMSETLRRTSIGIRDLNRGMRRVETSFENVGDGTSVGRVKPVSPVSVASVCSGHKFSPWKWSTSFFWDPAIKQRRAAQPPWWKIWGGLTGLGILLTLLLTWWVSEEVACEFFCHPTYAHSSPYPFAVNPDAPQFPFVLPTLLYRSLIQAWWAPLSALLSPLSYATLALQRGSAVMNAAMNAASQPSVAVHSQSQVADDIEVEVEYDYDWSMSRDEIMR